MKKIDPFLIHPELTICLNGIQFPLEYLYRGMLVTGQPGSGKTRTILMPLIRELLKVTGNGPDRKVSLIVADPKNELAPFLEELCVEYGRSHDLIVFKPGSAYYNPFSSPFMTDAEAVEKIISFANNTHRNAGRSARGDEMFWANAQRSLLGALIVIARITQPDGLTFAALTDTLEHVNRLGSKDKALAWLAQYNVPEKALRSLGDYLILPPETTRPCVSTSVANTLHFWRNEPLAQLVMPTEGLSQIDPFDIIHHGKILVIGCSSAAFGVSITPLLLALKEHFFTSLLSRDQIEVGKENQWQLINQTRPVFFIADEFQSYLTPDASAGELVALDRLRGFRAGYIAATQNLASIHSVLGSSNNAQRLISLFANQVYLSNVCPYTAEQASWIMGRKSQPSALASDLTPPLLGEFRGQRPRRSSSTERGAIPQLEPHTLAQMKTGEFWMRLANGRVFHQKSSYLTKMRI